GLGTRTRFEQDDSHPGLGQSCRDGGAAGAAADHHGIRRQRHARTPERLRVLGRGRVAPGLTLGESYLAEASSSSMTALNASIGCAPTSRRPLITNDGVPVTPSDCPSLCSAFTVACVALLLTHSSNFALSSPSASTKLHAFSFTFCGFTSFWFWKKPL